MHSHKNHRFGVTTVLRILEVFRENFSQLAAMRRSRPLCSDVWLAVGYVGVVIAKSRHFMAPKLWRLYRRHISSTFSNVPGVVALVGHHVACPPARTSSSSCSVQNFRAIILRRGLERIDVYFRTPYGTQADWYSLHAETCMLRIS